MLNTWKKNGRLLGLYTPMKLGYNPEYQIFWTGILQLSFSPRKLGDYFKSDFSFIYLTRDAAMEFGPVLSARLGLAKSKLGLLECRVTCHTSVLSLAPTWGSGPVWEDAEGQERLDKRRLANQPNA